MASFPFYSVFLDEPTRVPSYPLIFFCSQLTDRFVRYAHPKVIPAILGDCRHIMDSWGKSGSFDPFDTIYEVRVLSAERTAGSSFCASYTILRATSSPLVDSICPILLFPLMHSHMHNALHAIITIIALHRSSSRQPSAP